MPTVLFDFDSTLINCESLDLLLSTILHNQPEKLAQISRITEKGMNGEMPFFDSLQQRLAICAPTRTQLMQFSEKMINHITTGMLELVQKLQAKKIDIWIISGGLKPLILPVAKYLGIPAKHVHAAQLNWGDSGNFSGIDIHDPFSVSKLKGAQSIAHYWDKPTVMVGDGYTDYQVYQNNVADHFIIYTEHVQRQAVLATGAPEAPSISILQQKILLHCS